MVKIISKGILSRFAQIERITNVEADCSNIHNYEYFYCCPINLGFEYLVKINSSIEAIDGSITISYFNPFDSSTINFISYKAGHVLTFAEIEGTKYNG